MHTYIVTLFFHASVDYEVEGYDEDSAMEEALRLNDVEINSTLIEHLYLEFMDADIYEVEED